MVTVTASPTPAQRRRAARAPHPLTQHLRALAEGLGADYEAELLECAALIEEKVGRGWSDLVSLVESALDLGLMEEAEIAEELRAPRAHVVEVLEHLLAAGHASWDYKGLPSTVARGHRIRLWRRTRPR